MHHALRAVHHQVPQAFNRGRPRTFQPYGAIQVVDDLGEPRPLPLDVEWGEVVAQGTGSHSDDVQPIQAARRRHPLFFRQAAHQRAATGEQAIGATGVFPGDGIQLFIGRHEQDARRPASERPGCKAVGRKERGRECLARGEGIFQGMWQPIGCGGDNALQVEGMREGAIAGDDHLCLIGVGTREMQFHCHANLPGRLLPLSSPSVHCSHGDDTCSV